MVWPKPLVEVRAAGPGCPWGKTPKTKVTYPRVRPTAVFQPATKPVLWSCGIWGT